MERRNLRLTMRHRLRFAEANSWAVMPENGNQSNVLALSKQNLIKKSMLLLVALLIFTSVVLKAQSPQKINFQSIVRNTSGVIVSNKSVNFKITILSGTITGTPVYSETHLKTTDAIGLVSLQIGTGTVASGVFSSIDWGNALHFIKLEADFSGGNTYVTLGTQELMSVPYAMYAAKTDTASLNLTNRFAEKAPVNNPTFTGTVGGITKAMVGLGNVDNTSDANKPVSAATQTALDAKAPLASPTFTGTVSGIDKTMVGLGNVDNTSDASKPVSSAIQTALALKAPLASPAFTGTVSGIDKTMVGLGSVDNTTDASKPVSTATQTALDAKAPLASPTFTGTVSGIDKTMVGLGNVDNTSDANKPVSTATQTALNLKVNIADTASMLTPYLRKLDTASLSNRINLKLNISDTAAMLLNYRNSGGSSGSGLPTTGNSLGNMLYWNGSAWVRLSTGSVGQILKISAGGIPVWDSENFYCGLTTLSDIDNNIYTTVQIGSQCWMKENLRTRKYNDGTEIRFDNSGGSGGSTSQTWAGTGLNYGAHTLYAHDSTATPSNLTSYGYLYNWYAAAGIITDGGQSTKNICPSGWHVPTDAEWTILTDALDGLNVAGGKMKSKGTTYWNSPNTNADNTSGFSALPGGFRYGSGFSDGSFDQIRNYAFFWSATEGNNNGFAWNRSLGYIFGYGERDGGGYQSSNKSAGASVRCLRD